MTERSDPGGRGSGVRLTKEVLRALPPLDRADDLVDDQLPNPQLSDREDGREQPQKNGRHGQAGAGVPDHPQQRRDVAERPQAFAPRNGSLGYFRKGRMRRNQVSL